MSILILGVIFAVGLIALVGAAFLVLGEGQTEATPHARRTPLEAIPAPAPTETMSNRPTAAARPTILLPKDEDALAAYRPSGSLPNLPGSSLPSRPSRSLSRENPPKPREEELRARLNGHFHELSEELCNLDQQVGEVEQRLGSLKEIVARLTQTGTEHLLVEDYTQPLPGFPVEEP
jgi:hypothetical protein